VRIAVIGTGKLGATVGLRWIGEGHEVTFGTRHHRDGRGTALIGGAPAATCETAARASDVVLIAVPGAAVEDLLSSLGHALAGKIVIDATNKLRADPMHSIPACQRLAPEAIVYRAFNSLGWEVFEQPSFAEGRGDHLYCGPAGEHSRAVEQLITDVGLRPVRVGDLSSADLLDGWTRLYFALAVGQKLGRHIAFRVLSDPGTV
jgi:predicted dinucleotide-binding enzyme